MSLVIACDIDEVLFPYLQGYCQYYNRVHASNWQVADFHSYNFSHVHGGSVAEIADLVYAFHEEPEFSQIEPLTGAREAVAKLEALGEVHFVTSRQSAIADKTKEWIKLHFGFDNERVHIGNHWTRDSDTNKHQRTKVDMCRQIGATLLIDDSPQYAAECAQAGIAVILFDLDGGYGWNKLVDHHSLITRVHNWDEAFAAIAYYTRKCE